MKYIFPLAIIGLLLTSCKKDDSEETTNGVDPVYYEFTGVLADYSNSTIVSSDNQLIMAGMNGSKVTLVKATKGGQETWRTEYYCGYFSKAMGVAEQNGAYFICGETEENFGVSGKDIILIKTNLAGDTLWMKTYGGSQNDSGRKIIATSDGNLLIAARTESFGADTFGDIYLMKLNTNGDTLWTQRYYDQDQEVPFHLMETQTGQYLMTGTNEDNAQPRDLYMLKVNSGTGGKMWDKKIGNTDWEWGFSTIELSNGDLVTCGRKTANGTSQVYIVKTDGQGNVIWENEAGVNGYSEDGYDIVLNADGTYTITGTTMNQTTGDYNILLMKVDLGGNLLWIKNFGSVAYDAGFNLFKETNGDNIITGNHNGSMFITRCNLDGVFKQ